MSYFIKLEHTAHYKAKRQNTVKTNLHMCTQTPHAHTHTHTHTLGHTHTHTHTHTRKHDREKRS